ncbi:MAG TPA: family 43 glycosylhydrolase [Candidatus Eisenbergiella merdipullorum]|uniref:Family 43 glycosylhydrolase n=1 Tax=Candidatus Eisenbergiella merdipullorum TaxID=2838553 RepID=A0A9D2L014_9FIRM|nr:family 43 glycosylhydrolase [Candidatus Eisenbergiella merdipullorum]
MSRIRRHSPWRTRRTPEASGLPVTATLDGRGNFIVSSSDPAKEWSAPVWVPAGGIDPSLFFEDGRAWYCTNASLHPGQEEITLEEIDVRTGALLWMTGASVCGSAATGSITVSRLP